MANAQPQTARPTAAETANERRLQLARRSELPSSPPSDLEDDSGDGEPERPRTEEERYAALQRARMTERKDGVQDLGTVNAPNFQVARTRPVQINNLGGGMAERRREAQQNDARTRETLDRLKRSPDTDTRETLDQLKRSPDAGARETLDRLKRSPNESAKDPAQDSEDERPLPGAPLRQSTAAPGKMTRIRNADGTTTKVPAGMRSDGPSGSSKAIDQAVGQRMREEGFAKRLLSTRNRQKQKPEESGARPGLVERLKRRVQGLPPERISKNGARGGFGGTGTTAEETAKKMIGGAMIKGSWATLWLSFGHSVYVLDLLFFAGWASKYIRQYVPEVGRE